MEDKQFEDFAFWESFNSRADLNEFGNNALLLYLLEIAFLLEDTKETIKEWAKSHEIVFITSRPLYLFSQTKQFLDQHFCNYKLIFSSGHTNKEKPSKAIICMDEKVDLFIDDCLKYVVESSSKGIKSILLEKPWNIGRVNPSKNIFLANNWEEIRKVLKTFENKN